MSSRYSTNFTYGILDLNTDGDENYGVNSNNNKNSMHNTDLQTTPHNKKLADN